MAATTEMTESVERSERTNVRRLSRTRPEVEAEAAAQPAPTPTLDDPQLYLNRELTWLEFNRRVFAEAKDETTPLLERFKFLAIVASILHEFFLNGVGGLNQQ